MFEQSFTAREKSHRDRAIATAIVLQTVAVTGLVLQSVVGVPALTIGKRLLILPPSALKAEQTAKPQRTSAAPAIVRPRFAELPPLRPTVAPRSISQSIALVDEAPVLLGSSVVAPNNGAGGILSEGASLRGVIPPVQVAANPKPKPRAFVRLSSKIVESQLIYGPKPIYPKLARDARVSGAVRLQATIDHEGHIRNLQVLSGHPLLTSAALEAVRNWRYRPVFLNGEAIDVITEVLVTFTLQQ